MAAGEETVAIVVEVDDLEPDLRLIDALARLQLEARRLGGAIHVRANGPAVRLLANFVGLADVLGVRELPPELPLEAERQTECGEPVGEQEVVPGGDPPA